MAKTTANISIDPEIKQKGQELFADFGLYLSTAINIFLRQAIRENAIPFAITRDVPNAETMAAIEEVKRMKADPSLGKAYTDVDEMMKELLQ